MDAAVEPSVEARIARLAGVPLHRKNRMEVVACADAKAFIAAARAYGLYIAGFDGFRFEGDRTLPDMRASTDFSDLGRAPDRVERSAEAALRFAREVCSEELFLEFVLYEGPPLLDDDARALRRVAGDRWPTTESVWVHRVARRSAGWVQAIMQAADGGEGAQARMDRLRAAGEAILADTVGAVGCLERVDGVEGKIDEDLYELYVLEEFDRGPALACWVCDPLELCADPHAMVAWPCRSVRDTLAPADLLKVGEPAAPATDREGVGRVLALAVLGALLVAGVLVLVMALP